MNITLVMLYFIIFKTFNANSNSNKDKESFYHVDPIFNDFTAESNISVFKNKKTVCSPGKSPPIDLSEYAKCEEKVAESALKTHPHVNMRTIKLLETYRYPYKEYKIKTKDGYILTVYRITGSPIRNIRSDLPPVYLNHGILTASDIWFCQPGNRNLPIRLADEGYDVWLGNARGTSYSLEHEKYNYDEDLKFWDFTFHEMGLHDVPAVTDTIISETGYKKILYIGYSMGTTQIFISLSELPEMNDKILAAFLMAPIAYMGHCTNPLRYIAAVLDSEKAYNVVNMQTGGRLHSNEELKTVFKISKMDICVKSAVKCGLCDNFWFAMHGFNSPQMNSSAMPFIFSKVYDSSSWRTLSHYAQLMTSCKFQKYSYSAKKNLKLYGNLNPPEYKLGNINVPLHFYVGEQDNYALAIDVHITLNSLNKGVLKRYYKVKDKLFTHLDFIIAKDADKLVYNKMMSDMEMFRYYYNSSSQ